MGWAGQSHMQSPATLLQRDPQRTPTRRVILTEATINSWRRHCRRRPHSTQMVGDSQGPPPCGRLLTKMTVKRDSESQRQLRGTSRTPGVSLEISLFSRHCGAAQLRSCNRLPRLQLQKGPRANGIEGPCKLLALRFLCRR